MPGQNFYPAQRSNVRNGVNSYAGHQVTFNPYYQTPVYRSITGRYSSGAGATSFGHSQQSFGAASQSAVSFRANHGRRDSGPFILPYPHRTSNSAVTFAPIMNSPNRAYGNGHYQYFQGSSNIATNPSHYQVAGPDSTCRLQPSMAYRPSSTTGNWNLSAPAFKPQSSIASGPTQLDAYVDSIVEDDDDFYDDQQEQFLIETPRRSTSFVRQTSLIMDTTGLHAMNLHNRSFEEDRKMVMAPKKQPKTKPLSPVLFDTKKRDFKLDVSADSTDPGNDSFQECLSKKAKELQELVSFMSEDSDSETASSSEDLEDIEDADNEVASMFRLSSEEQPCPRETPQVYAFAGWPTTSSSSCEGFGTICPRTIQHAKPPPKSISRRGSESSMSRINLGSGLSNNNNRRSSACGDYHRSFSLVNASLEESTTKRSRTVSCTSNGGADGSKFKDNLYKTEMCHNITEKGVCEFGDGCRFAHSQVELREHEDHLQPKNSKYKTQFCKEYHNGGICYFGKRCWFIHEGASATSPLPNTPPPIQLSSGCPSEEQLEQALLETTVPTNHLDLFFHPPFYPTMDRALTKFLIAAQLLNPEPVSEPPMPPRSPWKDV